MTRTDEVQVLADLAENPSGALVRGALVAIRQGRLDAAARVMREVAATRPGLRWAAFLMALETAEWLLGGSVSFTTPQVRYAASEKHPLFEERWGAFEYCDHTPLRGRGILELEPAKVGLTLLVRSGNPSCDAVRVLVRQLETFLGTTVLARRA